MIRLDKAFDVLRKSISPFFSFHHDIFRPIRIQDPFTHIYQFDLGFPPPLQQSIANKFNNRCVERSPSS